MGRGVSILFGVVFWEGCPFHLGGVLLRIVFYLKHNILTFKVTDHMTFDLRGSVSSMLHN